MPDHPPREAIVNVIEDGSKTKGFRFEAFGVELLADDVLRFENVYKNQGFLVHYVLVGFDGYKFPDELEDALWARAGSKSNCPESQHEWPPFAPVCKSNDSRTLTVRNLNKGEADFGYTLRIYHPTKGWKSLDPGGENRNGGRSTYSASMLFVAALGTFAVTCVGLYTLGMLRLG